MKVEIWSDVVCPWCYIDRVTSEAAGEGLAFRMDIAQQAPRPSRSVR